MELGTEESLRKKGVSQPQSDTREEVATFRTTHPPPPPLFPSPTLSPCPQWARPGSGPEAWPGRTAAGAAQGLAGGGGERARL